MRIGLHVGLLPAGGKKGSGMVLQVQPKWLFSIDSFVGWPDYTGPSAGNVISSSAAQYKTDQMRVLRWIDRGAWVLDPVRCGEFISYSSIIQRLFFRIYDFLRILFTATRRQSFILSVLSRMDVVLHLRRSVCPDSQRRPMHGLDKMTGWFIFISLWLGSSVGG